MPAAEDAEWPVSVSNGIGWVFARMYQALVECDQAGTVGQGCLGRQLRQLPKHSPQIPPQNDWNRDSQ